MRKLMIATVLAGLSSVFVGCSEGEAPANLESAAGRTASAKADVTASTDAAVSDAAVSDAPPKLDLPEPELRNDAPRSTNELIVGDPAPPISIAKWVKGEPVGEFAKDSVYVVEFWATWCGPCIAGMPHIAALQTEYGDKVTFIGVTAEEEDVVSEFMGQSSRDGKLWSEVLTYRIALDQGRATNAAYMQAAGQNGIPCAFIVGKTGNVEWIGHPASIDDTLKQVVDGTWDSETARKVFLASREAEKVMEEIGPKINAALQSNDFKTAVTLIDQLIAQFPDNAEFKMARFQFLLKDKMFDESNKAAAALVDAAKDNALELNQLAWILATGVSDPGSDLDLALSAAKRAEELTESKNSSVLDTLARVLFVKGNIDDAIAIEKKAIEIASPDEKEQYEASLKEFETAVAGGDKKEEKTPAADGQPSDTPDAGK